MSIWTRRKGRGSAHPGCHRPVCLFNRVPMRPVRPGHGDLALCPRREDRCRGPVTGLNMALYADVGGKQFPVTRGQDVGRYQVSWSLDHKSAHAGTYEVRFFDEESYSLLRKAQRNNEDISIIPPLFTVSVDHRGTWNGPWVSTEVLAAAIGLVIYYLAFSAKSHIQA
ncbi:translocon-associated protein subunit delta isoform X5 [Symphalangus syndactylus]|uniref:translocon-associated protein subunit delta isoform X5 n=1 Tax=Symphalangus syndactylus TaxID=9590 RepID=UPI003003C0C6